MDLNYISIVKNDITNEDGTIEVLRVYPEELWRVFEPTCIHSPRNNIAPLQQWELRYSHTDVILKLRSPDGPSILLEGLSHLVDLDSVDFVAMPAEVSTRGTMGGESSIKNEDRLKRFVFSMYPDIKLSNSYENHAIAKERTEYTRRHRRRFQQQVPIVHAEPMDGGEEDSVG